MPDYPNIAFIGKAGAGKDTAAALLIEQLGYQRIAFADALKDVAEQLWGEEARTDRDKLQKLGAAVRGIDPDTWVNVALRHMAATPNLSGATVGTDGKVIGGPIAITDCRYHNEAWELKGEGFIIVRIVSDRATRINRLRANGKLGPAGWEEHESETALDDWPEDYKISNVQGVSKAGLLEQLVSVLNQEAQVAS